MKLIRKFFIIILTLFFINAIINDTNAQLQITKVIGNGAVLQRDIEIPIW
ncbi:MAG: hypothetical protein IPH62_05745 [Ignavibacteriae bacterium]|nr:hypothetical protein [Ignavibacteriota bacterium]